MDSGRTTMPDDDAYPGIPRWVKIGGIALLAIIVIVVIALLVVGGEHGPMRHAP